jgi:hypothetical protein
MNEELNVIAEDQRKHPGCGYSQSHSQKCSNNKDNEYICETLKRITRICPGERNVDLIHSSTSSSSSDPFNNNIHKHPNPFDKQLSPFGNDNVDPFSLFENIFDKFIGSSGVFDIDYNRNNPNHHYQIPKSNHNKKELPFSTIPPHKLDDKDYNNQKSNHNNNGIISGPIDKV